VATCKIDGNHRYSRIKNPRSLFVSRTWPGTWRCQNGQDEAEQSEHGPQTLGDSFG